MRILLAVCMLGLAGCILLGDETKPIPTEFVPARAPSDNHTLFIVLPGIFDDDDDLRQRGVHDLIQRVWPTADVMLAGATFAYYQHGQLVPRLHDEIVRPAQRRGYDQIWLVGGSLGAQGALMYEREYPGALTGLVLFSPWLGGRDLIEEIQAAGGARRWDPGTPPEAINGDNFHREVWRMAAAWHRYPELARRIWVACGTEDDRMLPGARLLAAELPASHYLERPGAHDWDFWYATAEEVLALAQTQSQRARAEGKKGPARRARPVQGALPGH